MSRTDRLWFTIARAITDGITHNDPDDVATLAIEARTLLPDFWVSARLPMEMIR